MALFQTDWPTEKMLEEARAEFNKQSKEHFKEITRRNIEFLLSDEPKELIGLHEYLTGRVWGGE